MLASGRRSEHLPLNAPERLESSVGVNSRGLVAYVVAVRARSRTPAVVPMYMSRVVRTLKDRPAEKWGRPGRRTCGIFVGHAESLRRLT
jgi:hypothetical protein